MQLYRSLVDILRFNPVTRADIIPHTGRVIVKSIEKSRDFIIGPVKLIVLESYIGYYWVEVVTVENLCFSLFL